MLLSEHSGYRGGLDTQFGQTGEYTFYTTHQVGLKFYFVVDYIRMIPNAFNVEIKSTYCINILSNKNFGPGRWHHMSSIFFYVFSHMLLTCCTALTLF